MALTPEQKKRLQYLKEQASMRKSQGVEQKKQADFQDAALEKQRKKEQAIIDMRADANKENEAYDKRHAKAQENINTIASDTKSIESQATKLMKDKAKAADKVHMAGKDHAKLIQKQLINEGHTVELIRDSVREMNNKAAAAQEQFKAGEISEEQANKQVKHAQKGRDIAEEHMELMKEMGSGMLDITALMDKANDLQTKRKEIVETLGVEEYNNMQEQIQGRIDLQKAMKLTEQRMETMDALTGGMASKVKGMVEHWKEMGTGMALKLGLLAGIATLAIAINAQADEIGDAFGAIGVQKFRGELSDAKATAVGLGYDFEAVQESVEALTGELGISVGDAAELSKATMDSARAMGMTASEAADLTAILATTTGLSAQGAQNFMKQTALLATAAGVAPKDVMADMAESSEEIATHSKDGGSNMAEAAVKARQMGMALSDVASIAEGLLDFSSSIEAEMEASVMTGKALNFQKARELALAGDLVGLQNEILTQVGSEAEWNEMNALQRQSMAEAIGVSVDQMAKMVKHAGKSTKELMKLSQMDATELVSEDAMGNITLLTNKLKQIGYTILADIGDWLEQNETKVTEIANFIEFIGKGLAKVVTIAVSWWKQLLIGYGIWKLINFVSSGSAANMLNMAKGAKDWVKNLVGGKDIAEKVMGSKGRMIKKGGKAFLRDQKAGFFDKTKEVATPKGKKGGGVMESMFGKGSKIDFKKMIQGAAAVLILSAALFVAAKAFQEFGSVKWPDVVLGLGAIIVLSIMARILGKGASNMIVGALAVAILGAALIPAAYAFSLLAGVDPTSIIAFSLSLMVLAAATTAFGLFLISGGFILFGAGVLALIALGGAVMLLAAGMKMAAPHLDTFKQTFMGLAAEVAELDILAGSMYALAGGLDAVGKAAEPAAKKLAPVVNVKPKPKVEPKKAKQSVNMGFTMQKQMGLTNADRNPDGSFDTEKVKQAMAAQKAQPTSYEETRDRNRKEREARRAKEEAGKSAVEKKLDDINIGIQNLVKGFGGKDKGEGGFAKLIGKATGKNKLQLKTDTP